MARRKSSKVAKELAQEYTKLSTKAKIAIWVTIAILLISIVVVGFIFKDDIIVLLKGGDKTGANVEGPSTGDGGSTGSGSEVDPQGPSTGDGGSTGSGSEVDPQGPSTGDGGSTGSGSEVDPQGPSTGDGGSTGSGSEVDPQGPSTGDGGSTGSGADIPVLPKGEGDLLITYIDVGQGDCILVQLPDGKNMLVDAGTKMGNTTQNEAITFIENNVMNTPGSSRKLDYLMLTHQDDDHLEFMADVVNKFEIGTLYTPKLVDKEYKDYTDKVYTNYTAEGWGISTTVLYKNYLDAVKTRKNAGKIGEVIYSQAGQQINENGTSYEMKILAPEVEMYAEHDKGCSAYIKNGVSPIFMLRYEEVKVLFTGDATGHNSAPSEGSDGSLGGTEEYFINYVKENKLESYVDCDVLKLGHHGSRSSSSKEFLELVKPEYAVICVGAAESDSSPKGYSAEQDICYKDSKGNIHHSDYCIDYGLQSKCELDEREGNKYSLPNKDVIERVRKYTDPTNTKDDNAYVTHDDRIYATDEMGNITLTITPQGEGEKGKFVFTFEESDLIPDFSAMEKDPSGLQNILAETFILNNPFTVQNLLYM